MLLFITLVIIFISTVASFVSRTLSPIPYFPSNNKDIPQIIAHLTFKDNQIFYDLGAGDGCVIFAAAQKAYIANKDTLFIAVEINPILLLLLLFKRMYHPNKKRIKIQYADIFSMRYTQKLNKKKKEYVFYLYISPWYLEKTVKNIKKQMQSFTVVSYFYALPHALKKKPTRVLRGIHTTSLYRFP